MFPFFLNFFVGETQRRSFPHSLILILNEFFMSRF